MTARLDRRTLLKGAFAGAAAALLPAGARGEEVESHGLSLFGDLKYPADFKHFDYIRPDAPKRGTFSLQVAQTIFNQAFDSYDSLHIFILTGNGAAGVQDCFASLMERAFDEPDALYGYAAKSLAVSADRLTYRFRLRPGLTFHDGSPLTAEDCAWSFNILKAKGHPYITQPLHSFIEAVAEAPDIVAVRLAPERGRDLPLIVAGLPIFSKAWWASRDFEKPSLEPPLGSGAYKVKTVDAGRSITFERMKDWWGESLPSQVGTSNFDELTFEYFRDRDVAFEAFKAGAYLFREEFTSRIWATQYDFPALKDGRVKREILPNLAPSGGQGWFFNTRRAKFADPRVRRALGMAFDFEWTNKTIMYGSFERVTSYFPNSAMMAVGPLPDDERALLEPFRDKLSPLVFGEAVVPPVSDGSGSDRTLLQAARVLLAEAGWTIEGGGLRNAKGEKLSIEFLDDDNSLEKHTAPLIQNLKRLGIAANFRVIDAAQFQKRRDDSDFDMLVQAFGFTSTPGEDLRNSFSAKAAASPGSYNLSGIADPVVDALIDRIIAAQTRDELERNGRALDRVLRAGFYWIPQWHKAEHWLAYWDRFEHPAQKPRFTRGAPETWWGKA